MKDKGPLDTAFKYISDENRFPPGVILPRERELAHLIGVSTTAVRAAIVVLKIKGALDFRPGKPIRVIKCIDECEEHY